MTSKKHAVTQHQVQRDILGTNRNAEITPWQLKYATELTALTESFDTRLQYLIDMCGLKEIDARIDARIQAEVEAHLRDIPPQYQAEERISGLENNPFQQFYEGLKQSPALFSATHLDEVPAYIAAPFKQALENEPDMLEGGFTVSKLTGIAELLEAELASSLLTYNREKSMSVTERMNSSEIQAQKHKRNAAYLSEMLEGQLRDVGQLSEAQAKQAVKIWTAMLVTQLHTSLDPNEQKQQHILTTQRQQQRFGVMAEKLLSTGNFERYSKTIEDAKLESPAVESMINDSYDEMLKILCRNSEIPIDEMYDLAVIHFRQQKQATPELCKALMAVGRLHAAMNHFTELLDGGMPHENPLFREARSKLTRALQTDGGLGSFTARTACKDYIDQYSKLASASGVPQGSARIH